MTKSLVKLRNIVLTLKKHNEKCDNHKTRVYGKVYILL